MDDYDDAPQGVNYRAWNVGWAYCFGYEAGMAEGEGTRLRGGTQAAAFADYREKKVIERGNDNLFALLQEDLATFEASL